MNHQIEDNTLTVFLTGHIDSANAAQIEAEISDIRAANPAEAVILDCEKLE